MGHYKKIRRSLKGLDIHPKTKGWIMQKRREEIDLEGRLAEQVKRAKAQGLCCAFIMPKPGSNTPYRCEPATPGRVCREQIFRRGYCTDHFLTHVLHLRDRKGGRAGGGVSVRPFAAYSFPSGRLSTIQEDLMADLMRLPLATPLEECIARLNEEDPSTPLASLPRTHLSKRY